MLDITFYQLSHSKTEHERLVFACKLAEKAYRSGQLCSIIVTDENQARTLDDLLWEFRPGSFIPHELIHNKNTPKNDVNVPILITTEAYALDSRPLIINLAPNCPKHFEQAQRILEIINDSESIKAEGRKRYKHYQQAGGQIEFHKIP